MRQKKFVAEVDDRGCPESSAFAKATADKPTPATAISRSRRRREPVQWVGAKAVRCPRRDGRRTNRLPVLPLAPVHPAPQTSALRRE